MYVQSRNSHFLKTAFVLGTLAGLLVIGVMIVGYTAVSASHFLRTQTFGQLLMLVAFSLIFAGVKRHRDYPLSGSIDFVRALALGTLMALFAGLAYVFVWELYLYATDYAFIENYLLQLHDTKQSKGFSAERLENEMRKLDDLRATYTSPLKRIPRTFSEIFPTGCVVALVSAVVLSHSKFLSRDRT